METAWELVSKFSQTELRHMAKRLGIHGMEYTKLHLATLIANRLQEQKKKVQTPQPFVVSFL